LKTPPASSSLSSENKEKTLFRPALDTWLEKEFSSEEKTAALLDTLIEFLKQEGLEGDLAVWIGSHLSKESIVKQLAVSSLRSISKDGIQISNQALGILVKIVEKHLVIEITPDAIKDLISTFIRNDFRGFLFND
jgi:V/A-type H+-transporting ATPase subunit E